MRVQLIEQAVSRIIGEARGADDDGHGAAWDRAVQEICALIVNTPSDEALVGLVAHDAAPEHRAA